jgi:hypothetical protein
MGHNAALDRVSKRFRSGIPSLQMTVAYSAILPPASLGEALRPLRDLSAAEFEALMAAIAGPRSFSLSKDELDRLRAQIPGQAPNLTFTLGALSFLYSHIIRVVESGIPYAEAISRTTDALDREAEWGEKKNEVRDKLTLILQNKETHQRFRKVQRLQSGFIPNALGFSTFVDLRPDFGEGEEVTLRGYLPIVQFRVTTDASNPDEKRLVFQMTEDALTELKKAIVRAELKLAELKKQPAIALQLVKF